MLRIGLSAAAALGIACAAPDVGAGPTAQEREYQNCLLLAHQQPARAVQTAKDWEARTGGTPAGHCAALALLGLGRYADAARKLETLADDPRAARLRADLLGQAGNAWLIAGRPGDARRVLDKAIALRADDVDLLIDRGLALATLKKYWEALVDLNRALGLDPKRAEALVFRASAHRQIDALDLAEDDITKALRLAPSDPDALMELAMILRGKGDADGARRAWRAVLKVAPNTSHADVARKHLADLE